MRLHLALAPMLLLALACGGAMQGTDDFSAVVTAPPLVAKGAPFTVTITVSNHADHPQDLDSIDIDQAWLSGVTVTGSTPNFVDSMEVPIDNTRSLSYDETIPAGGSLTVTLQATGVQSGSFSGDVDVCVGGMARFRSYPLSTTVE